MNLRSSPREEETYGLRKQWEKFHAMTWPKVFCKASDAHLNSDLQLLVAGTETMHKRSATCFPLCLSTRLHHSLCWGQQNEWCVQPWATATQSLMYWLRGPPGEVPKSAIYCSTGQCRVHRASSSSLSSGSKSKDQPSGLKTDVLAVVRSQAQHTQGSACPNPAQHPGAPLELCCIHSLPNSPPCSCLWSLSLLSHHLVPRAVFLGIATLEPALERLTNAARVITEAAGAQQKSSSSSSVPLGCVRLHLAWVHQHSPAETGGRGREGI